MIFLEDDEELDLVHPKTKKGSGNKLIYILLLIGIAGLLVFLY